MRTFAWEVGAYGLRVNLISPSAAPRARMEAVIRGQAETRGIVAVDLRQHHARKDRLWVQSFSPAMVTA